MGLVCLDLRSGVLAIWCLFLRLLVRYGWLEAEVVWWVLLGWWGIVCSLTGFDWHLGM